jgi:hypothetical protein
MTQPWTLISGHINCAVEWKWLWRKGDRHSAGFSKLTWSSPNSISRFLMRLSASCSHVCFLLSTWHVFHASENLKKRGGGEQGAYQYSYLKWTKNWTQSLTTASEDLQHNRLYLIKASEKMQHRLCLNEPFQNSGQLCRQSSRKSLRASRFNMKK